MLLTVDIGNTNITVALIDEAQNVKGTFRMTTKAQRTSDEYGLTIMEFCRLTKVTVDEIEDVIISSVVPKVMPPLTTPSASTSIRSPSSSAPASAQASASRQTSPRKWARIRS